MTTTAWRQLESMLGRPSQVDARANGDDPEPVARYFGAALGHETPTAAAAVLTMRGSIKIGRWLPFRARQLLAPRLGSVWEATVAGVVSGSDRYVDGRGGMSWKLFGLVPLMRAEGADVTRSAAERAAGESIWVPSAVSPATGTVWRAIADDAISAEINTDGHLLTVQHRIDRAGLLTSSSFLRWGDPDRSGTWKQHPFGVEVRAHRRFGSVRIPSRGVAGWYHGTPLWSDGVFFRFELIGYDLASMFPAEGRTDRGPET